MIPGPFKTNAMPIGIDLGARHLRMLQFARTGSGVQAVAAVQAPLDSSLNPDSPEYHAQIAEAIKRLLDAGDFRGKRVVSTLPAAVMRSKNLRLPPMPEQEMQSAIDWEASERLRSSHEQTVQYLNAGEVRQGSEKRQEIILLAVDEKFTEQHVESLTACGLQPMAIDAVPTALARVFDTRTDRSEDDESLKAKLAIDLGYDSTKVLIMRAGRVVFYKRIEIGGRSLDEQVAEVLEMPLSEAEMLRRQASGDVDATPIEISQSRKAIADKLGELGREIGLCLRYYGVTFRGGRPSQAYITGGGADETYLVETICSTADLQPAKGRLLAGVDFSAVDGVITDSDRPAWCVAAGLSLRGGVRATDAPLMPTDIEAERQAA
jgi:type IV pilus assembly protein PilM